MEKFFLIEPLGHGSFGRVWKAENRETGEFVAIKEIDYGTMGPQEKKLLVNEVNILRKLHNPHIVRYIDRYVNSSTKKIFIVMEFCAGGDLQDLIRTTRPGNRHISEDQIWLTLSELTSALYECHEGGDRILHRDIKPANVFIDGQGHVKLGDFGLAKPLTADFASTVVGTPYYMSPELVSGHKYDEKSDIWALGCVIYEMATLRPAFNSIRRSKNELHDKIRYSKPQRIPAMYSDSLWHCICSMIEKDPKVRPSARELIKVRNVALVLKLESVRRELTNVRDKTTSVRKHMEILRTKAEKLRLIEGRLKSDENGHVNLM
jgi:NIMA (never in mitosis gene a)-related kinase